jgi:hypothetical protein
MVVRYDRSTVVVVEDEDVVDDVVDEVVVDEDVLVVTFDTLRMPLLVGARKLKTKAPTIPTDARTASILRRTDHRVSDDSWAGGGGGGSAGGGGP